MLRSSCGCFIFVFALLSPQLTAAPIDYSTQIQPLFAKHCVTCHGPQKQKAGLRLDAGSLVIKGSLNGPIVTASQSKTSKLMHALNGDGEIDQMPPAGPLAENEIQLIARWIEEGAKVPAKEAVVPHWSFVPAKQLSVPKDIHPIDYFLDQDRKKNGLITAPPADKVTLLRRITLDLTGLPPTVAELDSFLADDSPQAFEKRIDALLVSPQYGVRWGRHFLDIWRYSDWYGYNEELRNSQKNIWQWRDWTVESLNANRPYDRMIREMLAGDEIAPLDPSTYRATGYLARNYYKFNRNVWLDDIIEHTGKAFLGVTLNCCRCHDHMYDPFTQEDYYRFRAIFEPHQVRLDPISYTEPADKNGIPRAYDSDLKVSTYLFTRGDDKQPNKDKSILPGVPAAISTSSYSPKTISISPEAAYPTLRESVRNELLSQAQKKLENPKLSEPHRLAALMNLQAVKAKIKADQARYTTATPATELIRHAVALHLEAAALTAEAELFDSETALKSLESAKDKNAKSIEAQKKKVANLKAAVDTARKALEKPPADYPALAPNSPTQSSGRRLALANWIASKDNPLTARVLVNHIWLRHFGQPLVPTVFDFGKNGRVPTNQALLDWLAVEFMNSNWDIKKLHRLMVTSQTYQLASSFTYDSNRRIDPDNLRLWRMNSRPLEAEAIRDSLLAISGLLDPTLGGPDLTEKDDAPQLRRSLYYRHAPEKSMPFLTTFDGPSPTECYRREMTVVPQQAMALANSKLSVRAAESTAKSLPKENLIRTAYRSILCREPRPAEVKLCTDYLAVNPPAMLVQALFNHADFSTIR